jgi:nitroimidazol reductase NimA-like FMN-containing flavoprotein (pyridoxamine 5'-phosphate oxidase superfamily)
MRRKDREMDKDFAYSVIDKAVFGTLATVNEDGTPYCIPVSIARKDDKIYFHSAKSGTKIDNIKRNQTVCMSFVGNVHVPEELNDGSKQDNTDSTKVFDTRFTTEFESAVVFGTISIVEDKNEKVMGLRLISEKYVPKDMPYFDKAVDVSYNVTYVLRLDIQHITGKRKKYDKEGIEMKWGRME